MEYVFGAEGARKTLKVKGTTHTCLTGYRQTVRELSDQTITDDFCIVRKLAEWDDSEGGCYDLYEIDQHYRVIDKTRGVTASLDKTNANLDYICMMSDINLPVEEADAGGEK